MTNMVMHLHKYPCLWVTHVTCYPSRKDLGDKGKRLIFPRGESLKGLMEVFVCDLKRFLHQKCSSRQKMSLPVFRVYFTT